MFAVKDSLLVDFIPFKGDPNAEFELPYDFKMATFADAKEGGMNGVTEESASV